MKLSKYIAIILALTVMATGATAEELTRNNISQNGENQSLTSVDAGSDTALNDERTLIIANNGNDTVATVKVTAQDTETQVSGFGQLTINDISIDIKSGDSIAHAPTQAYNNGNGRIELSYSGDTSALSVGIFRRPRD